MINKKFMSKSMAIAISGIVISAPMLNAVNAMGITGDSSELKQYSNDNTDEYNKKMIIEYGNVLTDEDFEDVYRIYEDNIAKGIELTDEYVRDLLVERIENKEYTTSTYSYNIFGQKVTKQELILVARHPSDAVKVLNNSKTASSEANKLYISSTMYLGNGDAFRHSYWNALNVKSVGVTRAKEFADAHESETPNGNDKTMDLRNNTLGRNIGKQNINSSTTTTKNKIIEAINKGRMHRLYNGNKKGKLIPTDSSGRR